MVEPSTKTGIARTEEEEIVHIAERCQGRVIIRFKGYCQEGGAGQ